jgi:hypothetical protein
VRERERERINSDRASLVLNKYAVEDKEGNCKK